MIVNLKIHVLDDKMKLYVDTGTHQFYSSSISNVFWELAEIYNDGIFIAPDTEFFLDGELFASGKEAGNGLVLNKNIKHNIMKKYASKNTLNFSIKSIIIKRKPVFRLFKVGGVPAYGNIRFTVGQSSKKTDQIYTSNHFKYFLSLKSLYRELDQYILNDVYSFGINRLDFLTIKVNGHFYKKSFMLKFEQ